MSSTVCIIPARGGSKRIPRKNVLPLAGTPLLAYTIRAAKDAGVFDHIVVSTEDSEIAALAAAEGVAVDDRPEHMSGDKVRKVEVVDEYLRRNNGAEKFDNVAALLPTCPFRSAEDVRKAHQMFVENPDNDFLIGVVAYDFPPQLALVEEGQGMRMMYPDEYAKTTRSQDIRTMYHPNGAIYMATVESFLKVGTFFQENMLTYVMPPERSFDIDYPYQFAIAEGMMKHLFNKEESK